MAKNDRSFALSSPSFQNHGTIPEKFTCKGEDISPEIHILNIPESTKSLAVLVDDPDAPSGDFVHWLGWNIDAAKTVLPEGVKLPLEGKNHFGQMGYRGPCPPPGKPHRYFFKVFALDEKLSLEKGSSKEELLHVMKGHILAEGELIGTFQR